MRKLTVVAVLGGLLVSGCGIDFTADSVVTQVDGIGPVRVASEVCVMSNTTDHPGCNNGSVPPQDGQLLLAFRVREGSVPPATFAVTTNDVPAQTLVMSRSASFGASITADATFAQAADERWAAYISPEYSYDPGPVGTPARKFSFAPEFGLPEGPSGGAFAGPFTVAVVVGQRRTDLPDPDDVAPSDPVICGGSESNATCFNDENPDGVIDTPPTAAPYSLATRDLVVLPPPAAAQAGLGKTLSIPFAADYSGPSLGQPLAVTGASDLPGATVTPATAAFSPTAAGRTALSLKVKTPNTARSGTYYVVLTAATAGGTKRVGTAKLALDGSKPKASKLKRRGRKVSFRLGEAAKLSFTLQKKNRRGKFKRSGKVAKKNGKAGKNTFKLRKLGRGSYKLLIVATDAAGNKGAAAKLGFTIR